MSRRRSIISLVVGLVLLIGAPALWRFQQPSETVGRVEPAATSGTSGRVPPGDDAAGTGRPGRTQVTGQGTGANPAPRLPEDVRALADGDPEKVEAAREPAEVDWSRAEVSPISRSLDHLAAPSRLTVPTLAVDAAIVPVGFAADGTMEIPTDVGRVGWFAPGIRPGRNGTAVLAGHVDSRTQGTGAFYALRRAEVGDEVTISHADGQEVLWRVTGRTSYGKSDIPLEDIFQRSGSPRLALITCGGSFDASTRSYQENVVVYAEPA